MGSEMSKIHFWGVCIILFISPYASMSQLNAPPLKIGIAGLTHSHVNGLLGRAGRGDIEIVGIAEPDHSLAQRYAKQYGYAMDLVFPSLEEMLNATEPEAVFAFNSIYEHLEVVEVCAPRGIHVMVEKPLAVNLEHAKAMQRLARQYNIHLLTNYETTWYGTHHEAYRMILEHNAIGDLRKLIVYDGHPGPKEIGVNEEFLEWLTDPKWNGGGAITDFGCYGANLITWLMQGQKPLSVVAVTQTFKPETYAKVDDEATIILKYPEAQGIVQASWNWPIHRKDMHIYGTKGYIYCDNREDMRVRLGQGSEEEKKRVSAPGAPNDDPFAYFAALILGEVQPTPFDLSSLENNMIVMEILDAAIKSAKQGKAISLE